MPDGRPRAVGASAVDAATAWAFATGWRLVRVLPERAAYAAFAQAADVLWRRRAGGVEQLERNLARACPDSNARELRELSRAGMQSYLRYWCDTFRLPTWDRRRVDDYCRVEGRDFLDAGVTSGDGIVVALGHSGNWDHLGAWACNRYGGLTTVAERLKPESLFDQFLAYRESLGMEVVPMGDADSMRRLMGALRAGRLVPLLADRDLSRGGVIVDLLGEPASVPAGPAALALLTGAPLHPGTAWFEGKTAVVRIHDAVDVPTDGPKPERIQHMMQQVADVLSEGIRAHPTDWHMMQPVWLADLDAERFERARA